MLLNNSAIPCDMFLSHLNQLSAFRAKKRNVLNRAGARATIAIEVNDFTPIEIAPKIDWIVEKLTHSLLYTYRYRVG